MEYIYVLIYALDQPSVAVVGELLAESVFLEYRKKISLTPENIKLPRTLHVTHTY